MIEPFRLEAGESIMWARREPDGGITLRVRSADGVESTHDVYPDQRAAEVEDWLAREHDAWREDDA